MKREKNADLYRDIRIHSEIRHWPYEVLIVREHWYFPDENRDASERAIRNRRWN